MLVGKEMSLEQKNMVEFGSGEWKMTVNPEMGPSLEECCERFAYIWFKWEWVFY